MEAGLEPWSSEEGKMKPAEYVRHMAQHVRATVKWVQECRQKYNRAMRRLANKAGRKVREYKVGDQVKLQAYCRQWRQKGLQESCCACLMGRMKC